MLHQFIFKLSHLEAIKHFLFLLLRRAALANLCSNLGSHYAWLRRHLVRYQNVSLDCCEADVKIFRVVLRNSTALDSLGKQVNYLAGPKTSLFGVKSHLNPNVTRLIDYVFRANFKNTDHQNASRLEFQCLLLKHQNQRGKGMHIP